jgi:SAM-dependent methyltransferase
MKSEAPTAGEFAEHYGVSLTEASDYLAKVADFDKEEQDCLSEIFAVAEGPVIELGAGQGEFTAELLERYIKPGQKLYAVERLETAAAKLREAIADPRLEVLNSDSTSLPLPDGTAGLVVSRAALHDFVSDDGDAVKALRGCVRALAPGGTFLVYDKVTDGFGKVERESAEGRMERINVQLASLEGKRCWGLHGMTDYVSLLTELGLRGIQHKMLARPDMPGYVGHIRRNLEQARPRYIARWGDGVNEILDSFAREIEGIPNRALPLAMVWGRKGSA